MLLALRIRLQRRLMQQKHMEDGASEYARDGSVARRMCSVVFNKTRTYTAWSVDAEVERRNRGELAVSSFRTRSVRQQNVRVTVNTIGTKGEVYWNPTCTDQHLGRSLAGVQCNRTLVTYQN